MRVIIQIPSVSCKFQVYLKELVFVFNVRATRGLRNVHSRNILMLLFKESWINSSFHIFSFHILNNKSFFDQKEKNWN